MFEPVNRALIRRAPEPPRWFIVEQLNTAGKSRESLKARRVMITQDCMVIVTAPGGRTRIEVTPAEGKDLLLTGVRNDNEVIWIEGS